MLPNLIIIGGMKCGTTGLHYYLGLHPEISMSRQKEVNFFVRERNWVKGIKWYESHFTGEAKIYGESSPSYTNYPRWDGVAGRMASVVPHAKLIYVVRDPVERMISQYINNVSSGWEKRPLAEALQNFEDSSYVRRSKYYMQLSQFLKHYPASSIKVVLQEQLAARRAETLREIFHFLGVDEGFHSEEFARLRNPASGKARRNRLGMLVASAPGMEFIKRPHPKLRPYADALRSVVLSTKLNRRLLFSAKVERPELDAGLRGRLIEHLRDDVNRLRAFTGMKLDNWCV